jgi:hypothetical protein
MGMRGFLVPPAEAYQTATLAGRGGMEDIKVHWFQILFEVLCLSIGLKVTGSNVKRSRWKS